MNETVENDRDVWEIKEVRLNQLVFNLEEVGYKRWIGYTKQKLIELVEKAIEKFNMAGSEEIANKIECSKDEEPPDKVIFKRVFSHSPKLFRDESIGVLIVLGRKK
jgi:hypothetical protein